MKVLLVAYQHGNEPLGELLYDALLKRYSEHASSVFYRVANPRAKSQNVRFTESDMNRSYNRSDTYEARQAKAITAYIQREKFDVVIDLHTTNCIQPPCFIAHHLSQAILQLFASMHIDHVVQMSDSIAKGSLIGACESAVSIEISNAQLNTELINELVDGIDCYLRGIARVTIKQIYKVTNYIYKSEVPKHQADKFVNFQFSECGYIPILVGKNSYRENTDYLGFKCNKPETLNV